MSRKQQIIAIDGANFNSLQTFAREIKNALYLEDSEDVKNWSVLSDVLWGGYGLLNADEHFTLLWRNYRKSKQKLSPEDLAAIEGLLSDHFNITLQLD